MTPAPFDITGPLPSGTVLLEASAGTGKTYTIAALVARYVAEGAATLEEMLVITFTRAATQELRDRVRRQLVEAEQALDPEATAIESPSDVLAHLLDCDAEARHRRHARLVDALTDFDAATIATTHQFCSVVLDSLGVAGDTDDHARLVEDLSDLSDEAVDDLYLRAFAGDDDPAFDHACATMLADAATNDPQAAIVPVPEHDDAGLTWVRRVGFAEKLRSEFARRKRRGGLLSYDDLLSQLADALADDGAPARRRMSDRWRVVLVDEFQDTDPVQWQVIDRAFTGHSTVVLIGDPKQAIYAFRGGDIATYLAARATARRELSLATNWRSDAVLLSRIQRLLEGAELGDGAITVNPVRAHHQTSRLPSLDPFRLRVVRAEDVGLPSGKAIPAAAARDHVARDVALDIQRLLTRTDLPDPVEPGDVAVLASKNKELAAIRAELEKVGVRAVVTGGESVFTTPAATEWLTLVEALAAPNRRPLVRAAALTCFLGIGAAELDAGGEELDDSLAERIREWADLAGRHGVAAVLEAASVGGLSSRLLAVEGGERLLTDIRHLGEVLQETAREESLGLVALAARLGEHIREASEGGPEIRTRRLDSDAGAVQLVTIHGSKGLQYPIVYLPTLWDRHVRDPEVPLFHNDDGRRCRHLGGSGSPGWAQAVTRSRLEDAGESLRLAYVALTRAQSQVVCWWAATGGNNKAAPLHRLLFGRGPGDSVVPPEVKLPSESEVTARLEQWQAAGGPTVETAHHLPPMPAISFPSAARLAERAWARTVDTDWRRTSYSGLSRAAEAQEPTVEVTSESATAARSDDDDAELTPVAAPDPSAGSDTTVLSPMAELPRGATFGSLVHAVLEHTDFVSTDLRGDLLTAIGEHRRWWRVELDDEVLAEALVEVCRTPLGPDVPGALTSFGLRDRLNELDFELPLDGGDLLVTPGRGGTVRLGDLAPLLRDHLPETDPIRSYADALDGSALGAQPLRGYLNGSVDLLARFVHDDRPRYLVVDYKTNWLGPLDGDRSVLEYAPARLEEAMAASSYPLQALLYTVVAHRFLRWRQPDYDPAVHLAGVQYHYVRGMAGPETPVVDGRACGVFSWLPPTALVTELSDLLDGNR